MPATLHPGQNRSHPRNNGGFTLIEVLVAVTLLLLVAVAFIPLFVFVAEASQANRARLVATNLAGGEIEYLRSLPFSQIGNIGSNPAGVIERKKVITIDSINFNVITDVWWVDDPSDGLGHLGTDPIPYDYKRVRVEVSAPGLFSGSVTSMLNFHTLSTLEGEEEAFPGGNLRATAVRGWKTGAEEVPVTNVRADLVSGPDAPQTLWTDEFGAALFAVLAEGNYVVDTDPSPLGMIVRPGQETQEISVTMGVTSEAIFEVEYPCRLNVVLKNKATGEAIGNTAGTITLVNFDAVRKTFAFTTNDSGMIAAALFGPLWPVGGTAPEGYPGAYGLEITGVPGFAHYDMSIHDKPLRQDGTAWDGTFDAPGTTLTVTVSLSPCFYREPPFQPWSEDGTFGVAVAGERLQLHHYAAAEVAQGRSASSNSTHATSSPANAFDGSPSTFWRSNANPSVASPVWLAVDLGETRNVNKMIAALNTARRPRDFALQGSANGSGWTTILSGSFPNSAGAHEYNFPATAYRHFRLLITSSHSGGGTGVRIHEMELYQVPHYALLGQRTSLPQDLSQFTAAPGLRIFWHAELPAGTSLTVQTAITNGPVMLAAGDFTTVGRGDSVPGITPGENLAGKYLWVRQLLGTVDTAQTPSLHWLEIVY